MNIMLNSEKMCFVQLILFYILGLIFSPYIYIYIYVTDLICVTDVAHSNNTRESSHGTQYHPLSPLTHNPHNNL